MKIGSTDINDIKLGTTTINKVLRGGVILYEKGPDGSPSLLNLTVISDTQIDLAWTIGSTNQDGHKIYISTDNITYTLKGTVTGVTATYSATSLDALVVYYFKVVAYKGNKISNYSNVVNDTTSPLEFSDVLVYVDGVESGGILTDKSGLGNNITIGTNLITNGNCEQNYGFSYFTNSPSTFERSSEQAHSGTYSWKVGTSVIQTQGLQSSYFTTKIGETINFNFWIRRFSGTATIRWSIYKGNGITAAISGTSTPTQSPNNTWVNISGSYTDDIGGVSGRLIIYVTTVLASFYVDDIELTVPGVNTLNLPVNSAISNVLVNTAKYYTSGNSINVRVDNILRNENDQLFFDDSYKILIYNKAENAKVIKSVFDWMQYSPASIYGYFTTERTAVAYEVNKHFAFGKALVIGSSIHLFYRNDTNHNGFGGILVHKGSLDNGITWSDEEVVYTGQEIIDNNAQILIDDPLAIPDVREGFPLILNDNYIIINTWAAIGHNSDINTRVAWGYKSVSLKIPYSGTTLDFNNKQISYISDNPYSGGLIVKDGVIYCTDYSTSPIKVSCYKSIDFGSTWTKISTIFSSENQTASESTLFYNGGILYCIGRTYLANGIICKSIDNGVTWTDYTSIATRLDGLTHIILTNGNIIVYGRNAGNNKIDFYKINGLAIDGDVTTVTTTINNDCGYGNIVLKDGIYYFLYGKGPDATPPIDVGYSYVGMYFKSIDANKLNNY